MPQGWDLGVLGGQKFNFLNMVMWHIKLKGMISGPGYTEKIYPRMKLMTLRWGKKVKYQWISSRALGFLMPRAIECVLVLVMIQVFYCTNTCEYIYKYSLL